MKSYVVDLNMLQDVSFAAQIQAKNDCQFLLPDVALVEMCKHENCQLTMKLALQVFFDHTDQLAATLSVGEALNSELKSRSPTTSEGLISDDFTRITRQLVIDLAMDEKEENEAIQERFGSARKKLLNNLLDAAAAKRCTEQRLDILKTILTPELLKAIRKPELDRSSFLSFIQVAAEIFCRKRLSKESGMTENEARCFIEKRPMYLREEYLLVWHCLKTISLGGDISSMRAEKELNHQLDQDYALIASYFDGILSHDKRTNETYDDLLFILATPSSTASERFYKWLQELDVRINTAQISR
jgi:hypothetical protein